MVLDVSLYDGYSVDQQADMNIRPYLPEDKPSVVEIWNQCLPQTAPHHQADFSISKKLEVDSDLFLVAVVEGAVAGTVMAGYDGHRGWIYSVAVHPSHQRQGVGSALVKHAEDALVARGCPKVNLQVMPANEAVVSFYTKLGYALEPRISMGKLLY